MEALHEIYSKMYMGYFLCSIEVFHGDLCSMDVSHITLLSWLYGSDTSMGTYFYARNDFDQGKSATSEDLDTKVITSVAAFNKVAARKQAIHKPKLLITQ